MKNKGYTFIELIISFALISIIALITLTLFSSTYLNIVHFGNLSKAVSDNQLTLERLLSDKTYASSEDEQTVTRTDDADLQFTYTIIVSGSPVTGDIRVPGSYFQVNKDRSELETFVR